MIEFYTTILHALFICIPFTLFVAISFIGNPRLWLHSLPEDIARAAGPKTAREHRVTRFILLPIFLLILPGLSLWSGFEVIRNSPTPVTFWGILVHIYLIWIVVHLWDLVVIDGIWMLLIDPAKPPIRGTEHAAGWKDFGFHIRSFFKAVVASAIFVVPAAFGLYLLT